MGLAPGVRYKYLLQLILYHIVPRCITPESPPNMRLRRYQVGRYFYSTLLDIYHTLQRVHIFISDQITSYLSIAGKQRSDTQYTLTYCSYHLPPSCHIQIISRLARSYQYHHPTSSLHYCLTQLSKNCIYISPSSMIYQTRILNTTIILPALDL